MIICTNCNHENPEGSVQCENCYSPLPKTSPCPNCGAFTQINATFCGQCGYNLLSEEPLSLMELDDDSENSLDPKDTIPHQVVDFGSQESWDVETEDQPAALSSPIADLEDLEEADSEEAELEQFVFTPNSESDVFEPDFEPDLEPDLEVDLEAELPEMSGIEELEATTASSESWDHSEISEPSLLNDEDNEIPEGPVAEIEEELDESEIEEELIEEEELDEIELEEFVLDTNEPDAFEPDFDLDLEQNLEAELPDMPDIDELETTTAKVVPEISSIEELKEELEVDEQPQQPPANPEIEPELEPELEPALDLDAPSEFSEYGESLNTVDSVSPMSPLSSFRASSDPIHPVSESATQLQLERIILFHVQTDTDIELSQNLDIIRIGKPNNQIPPDIDVSGFPDANIVSRVHANIRVEGNTYFVEDAGSSNGTYVNHKPLLIGNRHRLRFGDRISLGKGDLMTFIFKIINE